MQNKIPLLYCNNSNDILGGVEIFNKNLEKSFSRNNVRFYSFYKISLFKKLKLIRESISIFSLIIYSFRLNDKSTYLLLHHSNFLEIVYIPLLSFFFKEIRIISHVGNTWFHIRNKFFLKITNYILNFFIKTVYVISEDQETFFSHKNKIKINSIINYEFISKSKSSKNKYGNYILYLGRICKEKGIEDLIFFFSQIKKNEDIPNLLIVGPVSKDYLKKINNMIFRKKLADTVFLLPPVFDISEKINLIDNSKFGIYPSYYDAFPLTPIEFFSRNKICLASNISETKNFISEEFLFKPGSTEIKDKIIITYDYIKKDLKFLNSQIKRTNFRAKEIARGQIYKNFI